MHQSSGNESEYESEPSSSSFIASSSYESEGNELDGDVHEVR